LATRSAAYPDKKMTILTQTVIRAGIVSFVGVPYLPEALPGRGTSPFT
jgi:hypothetical protein